MPGSLHLGFPLAEGGLQSCPCLCVHTSGEISSSVTPPYASLCCWSCSVLCSQQGQAAQLTRGFVSSIPSNPAKPCRYAALLLPCLPSPALSQLLSENTNLLHHLQLLPEALHLLLYVLELILLHPQQHLGQRRGRGTRGDSGATASERPAGPGASTAVEKEGRDRRAGAGNGASSLREQRRGALRSAS